MLKSLETGETSAVSVVDESKYIQHNPQTHEGSEGLAVLFERLSKTSPRVNIVRVFQDGDFVFAHTEYDFAKRNIGFEVFRFEGEHAVEHWDNIQRRKGPNPAGHSMVDGEIEVCDAEKTEDNRAFIKHFVDDVLIGREPSRLEAFVDSQYTEHNPAMGDGSEELLTYLASLNAPRYQTLHRILADGNFVLTVCEGFRGDVHTSFYDLFRIDDGKIVEHWDTTEAVPPREEWKNDNGKF